MRRFCCHQQLAARGSGGRRRALRTCRFPGTVGIEHRPDVEGLDEAAPGDRLGQLLDRDAGLDAADVGLAQHQLVEGDVARRRQGDLLNGSATPGHSRRAPRASLDP